MFVKHDCTRVDEVQEVEAASDFEGSNSGSDCCEADSQERRSGRIPWSASWGRSWFVVTNRSVLKILVQHGRKNLSTPTSLPIAQRMTLNFESTYHQDSIHEV